MKLDLFSWILMNSDLVAHPRLYLGAGLRDNYGYSWSVESEHVWSLNGQTIKQNLKSKGIDWNNRIDKQNCLELEKSQIIAVAELAKLVREYFEN